MARASLKSVLSQLKAPSGMSGGGVAPFRIAADGRWFYLDSPIERPEMVKLFATVLRREADGYALVTPYERHAVAVEDAPFVIIAMQSAGTGRERRLTLATNVGTEVIAGPAHPIVVRPGARGDARPYVALGDGLDARLGRSVYYELAASAEPGDDGRLGVWSDGVFFPLEAAASA